MVQILYEKYEKSLVYQTSQFTPLNLQRHSRTISRLAPADYCVGFIDARYLRRIKKLFTLRDHDLKNQAIVSPGGLKSSLFGPVTGSSGLCYHLYGVAAYEISLVMSRHFLEALYPEFNNLHNIVHANSGELEANRLISSVRMAVENEFAHISTLFTFLKYSKTLRLQPSSIGIYYIVADLLKKLICLCKRRKSNK
ncbi:hypothetical protein K501DRAFT_270908 [Backusella circina FSU 941]|nr:hypothetical protein K501DRAFT_270908 [Backusella circina FSU 941]